MSHGIDEHYAVYNEVPRTARKGHVCAACREDIRPGDRYCAVGIVDAEGASTIKRCLRCQAIHKHLQKRGEGETWPDERLGCGEEYRDHWGEDPPPEIAALAFATADDMQRGRS
jgi:hypothetical protein